jgi:hypothetical protein
MGINETFPGHILLAILRRETLQRDLYRAKYRLKVSFRCPGSYDVDTPPGRLSWLLPQSKVISGAS